MDKSKVPEILACLSAASFHFAAGSVLGFSAILIPQLESPDSDIKVTKDDTSWIASVVALVTPVAALLTGWLVDRLGRLNTIRLATVPYVLGWLCIANAWNLPMLLLGRLLTGFSLAVGCNPAVVYITEVSRADFRGALICLAPSLTSFGMVVVYAKGALLQWRMIAWIATSYCLPPLLFTGLWAPESPVWLLAKGRTEDAGRSQAKLLGVRNTAGSKDSSPIDLTLDLENRLRRPNQQGFSLRKFLRTMSRPTALKPTLLLTALFCFQQFSGIYIFIFYSVNFFKDVGTKVDPYLSTIGIGFVRLVMGIITSFLLRNYGRRPLFMLSSTGMAAFIFTSGYMTREIAEGRMEGNIVPVACIMMYMILGVVGLMSIPWTMTAELFPLEVRGMAQGLMIAIANLVMFTVLKIYPFMGDKLGGPHAVQWLFAAVSLASVAFIFVFLPETHGKQLEEIQEYFRNNTIYILRKRTEKVPAKEDGEEMVSLKAAA